ncbi:MAG: AMP-binding protein [Alphaproteobacteria bacterium]|nr:AMP-binding protein [Alphaproteobacteria bacterium]
MRRFSPALKSRETETIFALAHHLSLTEWWPAERLVAQQLAHTGALIRFAHEAVPFQKPRLAPIVERIGDGLTAELFAEVPIMTRALVQEAGEALASETLPEGHGRRHTVKTTGSSGRPVQAQLTRLTSLYTAAATLRGHQWFRRDLGGTNVSILVTPDGRERRRQRAWATGSSGTAWLYSNGVPAKRLLDMLVADDPDYLQCHPSMLQELIHCSVEVGARPERLREVRTLGEVLEPGLRSLCAQHWDIPVRDNYSSEEFGILALQCPDHDHLHVMSERAIVEILNDDDQPCAPGEIGRVVVTGFLGYATPLIRYEIGDRAIAGAPCPCGRGLPVIECIIGRERQSVQLPSGERLFPVLDAEPLLLKSGVKQYQLVQTSTEEIDLNLVAEQPLAAEEEAEIVSHFQQNFRHPFTFRFNYVDAIARGPGGKFLIFESALSAERNPGTNIVAVIAEHAANRPQHPAIEDGERIITYGQLDELVNGMASKLRATGISTGDTVAVALPDSADHLVLLCSLARVGAVILSFSPHLPRHEVLESMKDLPVSAMIARPGTKPFPECKTLTLEGLRRLPAEPHPEPASGGDLPLMLNQSSGTTGKPKSFLRSHAEMLAWAEKYVAAQGWTDAERCLCLTPMSFVVGRDISLGMLRLGATVVVPRYDSLGEMADLVPSARITYLKLTPSHMLALLDHAADKGLLFPELRAMVVGSAPTTHEQRLLARERLTPNCFEQLGSNEAGLLAFATPADQDAHPDAVGRIVDGVEAQIVDDDGNVLPAGEIGQVRYRAAGYPSSYLGNPEASARAFRDGWFYPGDVAALSEDGYLSFKCRTDDVINNGGAKLYPIEVETALLAHPSVLEAAVFGWPHEALGEVAVACVVTDAAISRKALREFCGQRIAAYKVPSLIVPVSALPKNPMGKVTKDELKQDLQEYLDDRLSR